MYHDGLQVRSSQSYGSCIAKTRMIAKCVMMTREANTVVKVCRSSTAVEVQKELVGHIVETCDSARDRIGINGCVEGTGRLRVK